MFQVKWDDQVIEQLVKEEIQQKLKEVDSSLVFWDTKELKRRTCMSWDLMQKTFFFEKDFPKYKVGTKWVFPADKTKAFLLDWLEEQ